MILGAPHSGFALLICELALVSPVMQGRPDFLAALPRQYKRNLFAANRLLLLVSR